jgi:hypothetical protein
LLLLLIRSCEEGELERQAGKGPMVQGGLASGGSGAGGRLHGSLAAAGMGVGAVRMKKSAGAKARRKLREPRFCFKTMSDVDVLDDGYKWRKYGQKVVKNTQHPRYVYVMHIYDAICMCVYDFMISRAIGNSLAIYTLSNLVNGEINSSQVTT